MDGNAAKKIVDYVFKDIFGVDNPFTLEQARELFAYDVQLPVKTKSTISNDVTWGRFRDGMKVASEGDLMVKSARDEFMRPKKAINSIDQLLEIWDDINLYTGERYLDSNDIAESDGIYGSTNIYRSLLQFGSHYMVYCYNNQNSKYLIASKENAACVNGIRLKLSGYTSSSYDVVWSNKVSRSMYISECFDLYECMFCNNLRSKKYCIGNMQFEREEYMKIKEMVVKWTLEQLKAKV